MSAAHSPGRLRFYEDGRPELDNQSQILETDKGKLIVYFRFWNREDARRLAACWNACAGIPTAQLELAASWGDIIKAAVVSVPTHTGDATCTSLDQ